VACFEVHFRHLRRGTKGNHEMVSEIIGSHMIVCFGTNGQERNGKGRSVPNWSNKENLGNVS
jgi:hypothetical protein